MFSLLKLYNHFDSVLFFRCWGVQQMFPLTPPPPLGSAPVVLSTLAQTCKSMSSPLKPRWKMRPALWKNWLNSAKSRKGRAVQPVLEAEESWSWRSDPFPSVLLCTHPSSSSVVLPRTHPEYFSLSREVLLNWLAVEWLWLTLIATLNTTHTLQDSGQSAHFVFNLTFYTRNTDPTSINLIQKLRLHAKTPALFVFFR